MPRFELPLTTKIPQSGFQLGAGSQNPSAGLPLPNTPDLSSLLGGGGGGGAGEILGLVSMLQSLVGAGGGRSGGLPSLGLTTPLSQGGGLREESVNDPRRLQNDPRVSTPSRQVGRTPSNSGPNDPRSGQSFRQNPPPAFQGSFRGGTAGRAQEIARLVGGTVTNAGLEVGPQFTDSDQFNRANATITVNGQVFSFTQLENALVNRGINGLANTLALEGGITNQFTNDNATAGQFGRF